MSKLKEVEFLFPNPAKDELTVMFTQEISGNLEIYDSYGKLVLNKGVSKQKSFVVDIQALKNGLYFVFAKQKGKIIKSSKLIIIK